MDGKYGHVFVGEDDPCGSGSVGTTVRSKAQPRRGHDKNSTNIFTKVASFSGFSFDGVSSALKGIPPQPLPTSTIVLFTCSKVASSSGLSFRSSSLLILLGARHTSMSLTSDVTEEQASRTSPEKAATCGQEGHPNKYARPRTRAK